MKVITTIFLTFGFLIPQVTSASTLTELEERLEILEEQARELQALVIKRFELPEITHVIPGSAEIDEPVAIKGQRFIGPVNIFFDSYVAFAELDPVNNETIAFRVPAHLSQPTECSESPQGLTVCTRLELPVTTQSREYEVRIQTSRGMSSPQTLRIE